MSEEAATTIVPSATRRFLARRLEELLGLVMLALGIATLVALLSAKATDPSFNRSVDGPVDNLLGIPGAYVADLLLESLGLAGFLLVLAVVVWGWKLLRHREGGFWWLRLLLLPASIIAASISLDLIPWDTDSEFRGGLGGFAGRLLVDGGGNWHGLAGLTGAPNWTLKVAALTVALPLYYISLGIAWRRYQAAGQALASASSDMGRGAGSVFRLFRRKKPAEAAEYRAERYAQARPSRVEPRFGDKVLEERDEEGPLSVGPALAAGVRPGREEDEPLVERQRPKAKPGRRAAKAGQATLDLVPDAEYELPALDLLQQPVKDRSAQRVNEESLEKNARLLESVLQDFGVRGQIVKVRPGPVVTLYELEPAPGTKTSGWWAWPTTSPVP